MSCLLALGRNDADINKTAAVSEGFVSMDDIPALQRCSEPPW